jgi:hypothetical protein
MYKKFVNFAAWNHKCKALADAYRVALDAVNQTIVITVVFMDYKGHTKKNKRKMPYDRY